MSAHYRTNPGVVTDTGNNRQGNYQSYLTTEVGSTQHDGSATHGHQVNHGVDNMNAVMSQFSSLALPPGPGNPTAPQNQAGHQYYMQDQQVAYQTYPVPMHVGVPPEAAYQIGVAGQYPVQAGYAPLPIPYHSVPYTPGRVASYGERSSEAPGLENRRGSYSTNESTPATPFFGTFSDRGGNGRIAVIRSSFNTPSPEQVVSSGGVVKSAPIVDEELLSLLKENPPIPDAVPAVFTPPTHTKSIEQCLENRIQGNRNVYIRGLHPTTDDELLLRYTSRFGKVEQSKAIIDTSTGACKGYVVSHCLIVQSFIHVLTKPIASALPSLPMFVIRRSASVASTIWAMRLALLARALTPVSRQREMRAPPTFICPTCPSV